MANVNAGQKVLGSLHAYLFTDTSTGTTSACQLPPGKVCYGATVNFVSATGRAWTSTYVQSTGVLTIAGLTAADSILVCAFGD